jgi:hypothetical protein
MTWGRCVVFLSLYQLDLHAEVISAHLVAQRPRVTHPPPTQNIRNAIRHSISAVSLPVHLSRRVDYRNVSNRVKD